MDKNQPSRLRGVTPDPGQIRDLRARYDLSQETLAEKAMISLRSLRNAEAGRKVTLATLNELARALGVEVDRLIVPESLPISRPKDAGWMPPNFVHALLPSLRFVGREDVLGALAQWVRTDTRERVLSLVGMGGVGKTAVVWRMLDSWVDAPNRTGGLFVWSFYESDSVDRFLVEGVRYFSKSVTTLPGVAEAAELLRHTLSDGRPHLLVLDGLERCQSTEGNAERGRLTSPELRRLLRWIAAGVGTKCKAIVTSRLPLTDLQDWAGAGYREIMLDMLPASDARALLRQLGVNGTDDALDTAAASVSGHPLALTLLGSYLARHHGGDPSGVKTLDLRSAGGGDVRQMRLRDVLSSTVERLSAEERDALRLLIESPKGLQVMRVRQGADAPTAELLSAFDRMRQLGLVSTSETTAGPMFTVHPLVADFVLHPQGN